MRRIANGWRQEDRVPQDSTSHSFHEEPSALRLTWVRSTDI